MFWVQERRQFGRNSLYLTEQKAQAQAEGERNTVAAALHALQHGHVVFLWGNWKLKKEKAESIVFSLSYKL